MMHPMPTKNPRLSVTLQPALAAQLRRLSSLTGSSQSALISELLDGSGPIFERLISVLEAAEAAKSSIKGGVTRDIHEAQQRVESQLGLMFEIADRTSLDLVDAMEKVGRRRTRIVSSEAAFSASAGAPVAAVTPLSNRGVRSLTKKAKTPTRSRT